MQAFGGILLVAMLFAVIGLATQMWRTAEELEVSRRTVDGYLSLIEGIYGFRADHVTDWPTDFDDLTAYLTMLEVDPNDPLLAGTNGEGGRYRLAVNGTVLTLVTTVAIESHAQTVVREFGNNAQYVAIADGFRITVTVPAPGGITLMQQTLLTDGTNKMQRPLWIEQSVNQGDACADTGMSLDSNGNLMRCVAGSWQSN